MIGALAVRGRDARSALLASVALTAAFAAALPLIHGAAAVLAIVGASAGAADASTRVLIADPVVDETAGFLGIGLAGVIGGAVLGTAGPDALPQVAAALAAVVLFTAAVGLASNSRREGHRGPGALSTGSKDAHAEHAGVGSAVGIDRCPACGGRRRSEHAVASSDWWFRQSRVQICCHSTSCGSVPGRHGRAAARGNPAAR